MRPPASDPDAAREHMARLYAPFLAAGAAPGLVSVGARSAPAPGRITGDWIGAAFPCSAAGLDAATAWAADQNAERRNVYARPFLTRPGSDPARIRDGDVTEAGAVFTDHDGPLEFAALDAAAGPAPSFMVETGRTPHRRAHGWWMLDAPADALAWRYLSQALARFHGSDLMVCDVRTWARLAGFTSWPKDRAAGRIAELVTLGADTGRRWTVAELRHDARQCGPGRSTVLVAPQG